MKRLAFPGFVLLLTVILDSGLRATAAELPASMRIDLKRLEETWNILDQYAGKVWPVWNNYQKVPFSFEYPNGAKMLVGHPNPPDGYTLAPDTEILGRKVYVDRRNENALPLDDPMLGDGGIIYLGKGMPAPTIMLRMNYRDKHRQTPSVKTASKPNPAEETLRQASENQILINIHELSHCNPTYESRYDNLRFNPDANYAIYAEIEGMALEKAWMETDPVRAKEYLKDFLAARSLKRRSMLELEQNQESETEIMEGSAVFAESMILELMKSGYKPKITSVDDPGFSSFKNIQWFLDEKLKLLRLARGNSMDSERKGYEFGNFLALLLNRHYPGWQQRVLKEKMTQDQILRNSIGMPAQEQKEVENRLAHNYPLDEISRRHGRAIAQRDEAYNSIRNRSGKAFIVNFKPVGEYPSPQPRGELFRLGLMSIFPRGIETVRIQNAAFSGKETPAVLDQFYYVKWIDTGSLAGDKGYTIKYSRMEEGGIYNDAEFTCGGFTLKAPQIQVQESRNRVKVTVLKKI